MPYVKRVQRVMQTLEYYLTDEEYEMYKKDEDDFWDYWNEFSDDKVFDLVDEDVLDVWDDVEVPSTDTESFMTEDDIKIKEIWK